jgi:uncharacterized HAD superfamily protein/hypoxanthine phosphoribosyltransferase
MHFKSLNNLTKDIHEWIPKIEGNYDCVVGIPRSGMLVANILALKLSLPLADLDGFLEGRMLGLGKRFQHINAVDFLKEPRKVLIVDDSISSGQALRIAKKKIAKANSPHDLTFAAVYVTPKGKELCDLYVEEIPNPRRFEWNILASSAVKNYCFDMDGVLCLDPTNQQNDDGERYRDFILSAKSLYLPGYEIGAIVTSRLEKFRPETEQWLKEQGIRYGALHMLNLPSKEDRMRLKAAPSFKAEVFKKSNADLFIESEHNQAVKIAELSGKFVYALDTVTMHGPGHVSALIERKKMNAKKKWRRQLARIKNVPGRLLRILKHKS